MKNAIAFIAMLVIVIPISLNGQTTVPGSTEATFDVSDGGGANYIIPIKVPAGMGELQPSLSLNYNSQGGNGIMGMGWTLSGTSAITRIPATIYNDKNTKGVSFSANDRFSLDGNRLIVTSGSYGATGSQYHTEMETFKNVVANGTLGSGPAYFTVTAEDGTIYEYGATSNSLVQASGITEPYMWLLDKVTALNGNYMTFEYTQPGNGEVLLNMIKYNCNQSTGLTYQSYISFSYASKSDPEFKYMGGAKIFSTMKLTKISCIQKDANGTWYYNHSYGFTYSDDFYTHLTKVTETGENNTDAFSPTQFTYGTTNSFSSETHQELQSNDQYNTYLQGDYNGDGKTDFIKCSKSNTIHDYALYLSQGASNSFSLAQTGTLQYDPQFTYTATNSILSPNQVNSLSFDYNGDGKQDVIYCQSAQSGNNVVQEYWISLSTGTGITSLNPIVTGANTQYNTSGLFQNTIPLVGDFDGDGKSEVLTVNNSASGYAYLIGEKYNTATSTLGPVAGVPLHPVLLAYQFDGVAHPLLPFNGSNGSKLFVIDYNGDGKSDILWVNGGTSYVYELNVTFDANNNPIVGSPAFKLVNSTGYPSQWHDIFIGDFNGDRISDVLTYYSTVGWEIGYGKGNGIMNDIYTAPNAGMPGPYGGWNSLWIRPIQIADMNGDGKDDIFDFNQSYSPKIYFSKGSNAFVTETPALDQTVIAKSVDAYWIGDYNGDGALDFLTRSINNATPYLFSLHPNETRHQIGQIQNGLNAVTKINYASLSNPSIYALGNSYSYPYATTVIPFKVVSSVVSDNGVNTSGNTISYQYSGLKFNLWGKGLMGFDAISTHDVLNNIDKVKTYSLNTTYAFPYLSNLMVSQTTPGYIVGNRVYLPVTKPISSTSSNFAVYHYGNLRIFPYMTSSTSTNSLENTTVTETYNYTTPPVLPNPQTVYSTMHGKPMSITINKGNGLEITTRSFSFPSPVTAIPQGNGTAYMSPNPLYTYTNPSGITTTTTRAGQPAYTRTTQFAYNAGNGQLASTTTDPSTANAVTSAFTYDTYNNIIQKTTNSTGLTPITENFVYDASNRFLIKSYNSAFPSVIKQASYDVVSGNVTKTIEPDGLATTYTFDGFGRIKTSAATNGASTTITTVAAGGNTYAPYGAQYMTQSTPNTALSSFKFYDRLGRLLRNAYPGFDGTMIYEDITYNANGQVATKSKPYFQNSTPQLITYYYDSYTRQTTEARPEGMNSISYSITGGNYTTITQDMAGAQKITTYDPSGKTISVNDNGGTLSYIYHSNGQPIQISSSSSGVVSKLTFDNYGHKLTQMDPNYGGSTMFQYSYNAYGQVTSQKDPHGNTYNFTYDATGKMITKSGPEGAYNYNYYTSGTGVECGKLNSITGPGGITQVYYHGLGDQLMVESLTNSAIMLQTYYTYDANGRVASVKYPNGTTLSYTYNLNDGSLQAKGITGETILSPPPFNTLVPAQLFNVISKNAFGEITAETQQSSNNYGAPFPFTGYNIGTIKNYDNNGYLTSLSTSSSVTQTAPGVSYSNYKYTFEPTTGNLLQRIDQKYNLQEDFSYDNLKRLTTAQGKNLATSPATFLPPLITQYLSNGNISQKSDAGTFTYDQANRVSTIDPYINIPDAAQSIAYTPFNKVQTITEGSNSATFTYWADGSRSSMALYQNGVLQKTKYYVPNFEREINVATGQIKDLCYVTGSDGKMKAILVKNNGVDSRYYVGTDHLGSITQIIDANGNLVEEKSFDAWGRARDPHNWIPLAPTGNSNGWDRGYTTHELIPQFGIINMNGRLYDPLLGRMFSPDDYVQAPGNTQSFNRYTYCMNNPLKYTDANGEWWGWDDAVVFGVGAVVGWAEYGATTHHWGWKAIANGVASGALADLGYNTFGAATVAAKSIGETTIEYGTTYALASGASYHRPDIGINHNKGAIL